MDYHDQLGESNQRLDRAAAVAQDQPRIARVGDLVEVFSAPVDSRVPKGFYCLILGRLLSWSAKTPSGMSHNFNAATLAWPDGRILQVEHGYVVRTFDEWPLGPHYIERGGDGYDCPSEDSAEHGDFTTGDPGISPDRTFTGWQRRASGWFTRSVLLSDRASSAAGRTGKCLCLGGLLA